MLNQWYRMTNRQAEDCCNELDLAKKNHLRVAILTRAGKGNIGRFLSPTTVNAANHIGTNSLTFVYDTMKACLA